VLMAMLLIDQDKQRIPWRIVLLALIVVAACSWHWRHLYVDRRGMSRMPAYNAPLDALYGVVWGVSPWIIALGARHLRGRRSDVNGSLSSMALGAAVVGGFVGLRAMVRITVLWLIGWLILRVARTRDGSPLTPLAALWLATLLHLMFWKQLAVAFSW